MAEIYWEDIRPPNDLPAAKRGRSGNVLFACLIAVSIVLCATAGESGLNFLFSVNGLIFYGFPLHATGKPSTDRADHLKDIKIPMLFLQGTKDTLATIELIEAVCKSLSKATLVKFEGADHSFKKGKESNIDIIAEKTLSWVKKKIA